MQTRLSTLHEKVLRHDYTKYAYVYIVFLGPENKRKRGKRRTSRRPRNQKGIACISCSNDGEETKTRSGKCESKGREEEEEAKRGTRGKGARRKNIKKERRKRETGRMIGRIGTRQRFVQEPAYTGNSGSSPPHGSGP